MAYSEKLANRIREGLAEVKKVKEKESRNCLVKPFVQAYHQQNSVAELTSAA